MKKSFLIFQEIGLSSHKNKKFQEGTFWAQKIKKKKKKNTLKEFLIDAKNIEGK